MCSVEDGVNGESAIGDLFCNKYQILFTSFPYDQETDISGSVDRKVINMCNTGECSISHKICVQDVVNVIEKLKQMQTLNFSHK